MEDIRIVHDSVGVYSDWKFSSFHEGIQEPWLTRHWHDYFEGKAKPHFPVPALRTVTGFKMYYGKDRKPERLILGTWLIDRLELRYLLYVFKWRVMF